MRQGLTRIGRRGKSKQTQRKRNKNSGINRLNVEIGSHVAKRCSKEVFLYLFIFF